MDDCRLGFSCAAEHRLQPLNQLSLLGHVFSLCLAKTRSGQQVGWSEASFRLRPAVARRSPIWRGAGHCATRNSPLIAALGGIFGEGLWSTAAVPLISVAPKFSMLAGRLNPIQSTCDLVASLKTACATRWIPLLVSRSVFNSSDVISVSCTIIKAGRFPVHWSAAAFTSSAIASSTLSGVSLSTLISATPRPGR